jgi:hypothetical protein
MAEVFISYAHADDQSLTEGSRGWVTALADRLQKSLAMQRGGARTTVWMDHRLEPQKQVNPELSDRVNRADCFVAVLSPRYLESRWCCFELEQFVSKAGQNAGRVFVVEMAPTDRGHWPVKIQGLSTLQFWSRSFEDPAAMPLGWPEPDPCGDRPYWRALNELSHFVSSQLQLSILASGDDPGDQPYVWIADPTDYVLDMWERLAGALRQQGCRVLPSTPGAYPMATEGEYRAALQTDLSRARLLVQLLGPHAGRRPLWSQMTYTLIQATAAREVALANGTSLDTWRSSDVMLEAIADRSYAEVLTGATAGGYEQFQQHVLARARAPRVDPTAQLVSASAVEGQALLNVCVNADAPDRALGAEVRDILFELGAEVSLAPEPMPNQAPAEWRRDYEAMLAESHGVVIVYGATQPSWVHAQVQAARKLLARSRRGMWGALLDGPGQQPDHGIRSHSLMMLDCRSGLLAQPLAQFLQSLRRGIDAAGAAHA